MSGEKTEPVDVLMVNWNGAFFVRHFLPLALELTPEPHRFLVWDNASRDGSRALLRQLARRHPQRLHVSFARSNLGHATGLEGLLAVADRALVIFLDCDAVPLEPGWVDRLVAPVRAGAVAHGIWFADYLHPSCLCVARASLRELAVKIQPFYFSREDRTLVVRDVLQDLTVAAQRRGDRLERLEADGGYLFDGFGQTYGGGLVYHHWFGTRVNCHGGVDRTQEGRTRAGFSRSLTALEEWLRSRGLWRTAPACGALRTWVDERLATWAG